MKFLFHGHNGYCCGGTNVPLYHPEKIYLHSERLQKVREQRFLFLFHKEKKEKSIVLFPYKIPNFEMHYFRVLLLCVMSLKLAYRTQLNFYPALILLISEDRMPQALNSSSGVI